MFTSVSIHIDKKITKKNYQFHELKNGDGTHITPVWDIKIYCSQQ